MKPFVAVIGSRNSGKSTVICSLTGCERHGFRGKVEDRASNQKLYVIASSPQEKDLSRSNFNRILNEVLDDNSILGIVVSIQPNRPRDRLSMEDIFDRAELAAGFNIFAIMLDPPYNNLSRAEVEDVRRRLQERGIQLNVLNGQHFAHFNACDIRALTGLP